MPICVSLCIIKNFMTSLSTFTLTVSLKYDIKKYMNMNILISLVRFYSSLKIDK